jgi:hypothetical protein
MKIKDLRHCLMKMQNQMNKTIMQDDGIVVQKSFVPKQSGLANLAGFHQGKNFSRQL